MTTEIADDIAVADGPSDADLITAVRAGDADAYGQLYSRHVDAARRLARTLAHNPTDVDDLVAEVFAKLLVKLKEGGGPDVAFRTYLLTSIRNSFYDRTRRAKRVEVTDDVARHDPGVPFVDTAIEGLERSLAARAFARLPERLQLVLWHTEVEGETPATVAPLLSLTPNGVSALAYRARERLRQAYLQEHLADDVAGDDCGWTVERLGVHVRGGLSNRESGRVQAHLSDCGRCRALYADLGEVNSGLRGVLAPLVLGGSAAGYLTGGGKVTLSLASLWSGVRHTLSTWTGQVAVAGGGVAAATVVVLAVAPHITSLQAPEDTLVTPRPNAAATAPPPGAPGSPTPGGGRATGGAAPAVPGATPGGTAESGGPSSSQGPDGSTASAPWSASPDVIDRNNPGRAAVTLSLSPAGSLSRGTASTLVLSLTNDGWTASETPGEGPATARVTAELALPRGVTLRAPGAGDQWQCAASSSGAVCRHPSVPAGWTTTARIPVTVAPDAESGVPWATVTSSNIGTRTVQSTSGVTGTATADGRSDVAPSRTADQDSQDGRPEDD